MAPKDRDLCAAAIGVWAQPTKSLFMITLEECLWIH